MVLVHEPSCLSAPAQLPSPATPAHAAERQKSTSSLASPGLENRWVGSLPLLQCYHGGAKTSCELSKGQDMAGLAFGNSAGLGHTARAGKTCCSCWVTHRVWACIGPSPSLGFFLRASLPELIPTSGNQGPRLQKASLAH